MMVCMVVQRKEVGRKDSTAVALRSTIGYFRLRTFSSRRRLPLA